MLLEDRLRRGLIDRLADANPSPGAWPSILRRIARRERARVLRVRIVTSLLALGLSAVAIVVLWQAFRPLDEAVRPGGEGQAPEGVPSQPGAVCHESRSSGDFDADGTPDTAILSAVVSQGGCGPAALEAGWRFEISIVMASAAFTVPFADCESLFDCELLDGEDVDADGRSELPIVLSNAASAHTGIYRVTDVGVEPIIVAAPGDPGFVEPGPVRFGGEQDAIASSGFDCRVEDDGSRVLVAWSAERDDGASPYRMHVTTLVLDGEVFRVVATEERRAVTELPPLRGTCP